MFGFLCVERMFQSQRKPQPVSHVRLKEQNFEWKTINVHMKKST